MLCRGKRGPEDKDHCDQDAIRDGAAQQGGREFIFAENTLSQTKQLVCQCQCVLYAFTEKNTI